MKTAYQDGYGQEHDFDNDYYSYYFCCLTPPPDTPLPVTPKREGPKALEPAIPTPRST